MKKIVAKALVKDGTGKILVLLRGNTHPNFPGHFDLPGGEVDNGESVVDAVFREISEETSLATNQKRATMLFRVEHPKVIHVLFEIPLDETAPEVKLSWEHGGFAWLTRDEIVSESVPEYTDPYFVDVLTFLKKTRGL